MFRKVLIANRGEIAVRVIRACREAGLATVAIYSEADRSCLHARLADEAVCVGAAPSSESYRHRANIISAALITGADAIHPGYGFLAENADFAEECAATGLKFIGPTPQVIRIMGDKAIARALMQEHRVPVIPGSEEVIQSEQDALRAADLVGYPLIVKAAAGGGGKGMRIVHTEEDLLPSVKRAQTEAASSFGNPDVYLEKYIEEPRHIEVQILADEHGTTLHLGERDCSVQTEGHQKMLEEAPAASLRPELREAITSTAVRAAASVGYQNAGTIEFLVDRSGHFYFLEMNTRIQVEHPVTEWITGIDLVAEQIRIAAGEPLRFRQDEVTFAGHAIECRITAEDPTRRTKDGQFVPSAGKITRAILPGGFGVRVDSHLYEGYMVPPYYDSLLCKLAVWAPDRPAAIARMDRALAETQIEGIRTTVGYHRRILHNAWFRRGEVYTNFIRRRMDDTD
jgi:acetyl-CoA carboxylase biotin carboxylase subunit